MNDLFKKVQEVNVGENRIELLYGDIANYDADVIVIPATPRLQYHGVGIQKRIEEVGGIGIFYELEQVGTDYARSHSNLMKRWESDWSKVLPFSAHLTRGGKLFARNIIHLVAMDFDENGTYFNEDILRKSVKNALELCIKNKFESFGFCLLGDDSISYEIVVKAMVNEFRNALKQNTSLENIALICDEPSEDK
jgi:O-acetyl-ADP-ribose deacetylase (regulator of RNase III)